MKKIALIVSALALALTGLMPATANDEGSCYTDDVGEREVHNPTGDLVVACAFGFGEAIILDWHTREVPDSSYDEERTFYRARLRDLDTGQNFQIGLACDWADYELWNPCGIYVIDHGANGYNFPREVPRQGFHVEIREETWGIRLVLWNTFPHGRAYGVEMSVTGRGPGYQPDRDCLLSDIGHWAESCPKPQGGHYDSTPVMPINTNHSIDGGAVEARGPMSDCMWLDYVDHFRDEHGWTNGKQILHSYGPTIGGNRFGGWDGYWWNEEGARNHRADVTGIPRVCNGGPRNQTTGNGPQPGVGG